MKQYILKLSGVALLLGLTATGAFAQQDDGDKKKVEKSDIIVVRPKDGKDTKVTIEVKDGEVKVNGKPLSEFKDDDVTVTRRKSLDAITVTGMPSSRFRNGAWSYSSDDLINGGGMMGGEEKAFLGVTSERPGEGSGARLQSITEGSAAEKAGFKKGDIITKINDQNINSPEDLTRTIGKCKPEEKVNIAFRRDGKEQTKPVVLGKRKTTMAMAFGPGNFNFDHNGETFNVPDMTYGYGYRLNAGSRRLGIKAQETEDGKGVKVLDVADESAADKAGIKEDDIITEFDGVAINNVETLRETAAKSATKPSFKIKVLRDGKPEEILVKIPKNLKTANL